MARIRNRSPRPPPFPTRDQSSPTSSSPAAPSSSPPPANTSSFHVAPPSTSFVHLSFPAPYILLVTLSRPASLNCIDDEGHHELAAVWTWFDSEPSLCVGIVTGAGKAFCAGADLIGKCCFEFERTGWGRRNMPGDNEGQYILWL